jgi:hypothetical protein
MLLCSLCFFTFLLFKVDNIVKGVRCLRTFKQTPMQYFGTDYSLLVHVRDNVLVLYTGLGALFGSLCRF